MPTGKITDKTKAMMKKRLIMHVGLPKTGTTSIQNALAAQADALEEHGVLFPTIGRSMRQTQRRDGAGLGWHQPLLAILHGRGDSLPHGEVEAWRAELSRFARSPHLHTLVFSHESIGGNPGRFDYGFLDAAGEVDREIVVVLREAEVWLASYYEQSVRGKGRQRRLPDRFPPVLEYLGGGYEAIIGALEATFPDAQLVVLSFETLAANPGLVANFAMATDLPESAVPEEAGRSNRAISQRRVAMLRLINTLDLPEDDMLPFRRAVASSRRGTPNEPRASLFSPETAEMLARRYGQDRAYLKERFDVTLSTAAPLDRSRIAPMTVTIEDIHALETSLAPLSDSEERALGLIYAHPDFADEATGLPPPRPTIHSPGASTKQKGAKDVKHSASRKAAEAAVPSAKQKGPKSRKASKRPAIKIIQNIPYGSGRISNGDLVLEMDAYAARKRRDARPVQLIHGGGFGGGSRAASHLVQLARALAERGFAVFSIDYRLSGENAVLETMSAERGEEIAAFTGYPEAVFALAATEDAAKARAYVDARRADFGIGGGKWSVVGNSAGAVAALMTGYAGDDFWGKSFDIGAVVDMWGLIPAEVMSAGDPPLLIVHGTADKRLPYETSTALVERGAEVGVKVERITLDGVQHGSRAAGIFERPYQSGTVADRVIAWLDENADARGIG